MHRFLISCFVMFVGPISTASAFLYAVDFTSPLGGQTPVSSLYKIDTVSLDVIKVGEIIRGVGMIGLVVDEDNTIYAINENSGGLNSLWTVDPDTAVRTKIGDTGVTDFQEGDMTIDPATGLMYVANGAFGSDNLHVIDKATGTSTVIGGFGANGRDISGMQFIDDKLYGIVLRDSNTTDQLVIIDKNDASVTVVGDTGTNFGTISGMGRDPQSDTVFIAGPATDYGNDNLLYSLDLTTGAATLVGPLTGIDGALAGFSVAGDPSILVPEPGSAALAWLAFLGLVTLRRSTK